SGARDVADVEREAAERDEYGERVAETGEHQVRDVLRPSFGDGDDAPDVELCGDVEQDGDENREAEAGAEPRREDGRLGEETGAHGGRRHEERRTGQRGGAATDPVRVDREGHDGAATRTPAPSSTRRTARAMSAARGPSPWMQMVSGRSRMSVPSLARTREVVTMRSTRSAAASGSSMSAPDSARGVSEPSRSYPRSA